MRDSFPRIRVGIVRNAMTNNMMGTSITREAFLPAMVELCGMSNGARDADMPLTSTRLKRLAPITLPSDKEPCPFAREVMAVTSSGSEVPRATKVRAITDSGTPIAVAISVPLSTRKCL